MTYPEAKMPQTEPSEAVSPALLIGYVVLLAALCAISFHGVVELGLEAEDQEYIGDAGRVLNGSGTLFSTGRTYAGRPVGEVVFVAAYALWAESAVAYHVLVVLLHFCASILTAKVLIELGIPLRVGAAAGVLFAVHVPHYQVVHWVSGIAYPLYYCLALLSISSLVIYLRAGSRVRLVASSSLIGLAVFSHAAAIAFLPFGLLLIWWLGFDLKKHLIPASVYAAGAVIPFATILLFYGDAMTSHGAEHAMDWGRIAISWLAHYGNLLTSSYYLSYPTPLYTDPLTIATGVAAVLLVGMSGLRGYKVPFLALTGSFVLIAPFIATHVPFIQYRYHYAASLGASLLGAWFFATDTILGERDARWVRNLRLGLGIVVVAASTQQLQTSLGLTHARDARSLVSVGQSAAAVHHHFKGHEIAGHLLLADDYVRLANAALFEGIVPDQILTEAISLREEDPILQALLGVSKVVQVNPDSQEVGASLIQTALSASPKPAEVAAVAASGLYTFGSHLFNTEAYLRAVRMFDITLTLDASRVDALCLKAESFLLLGAADSAKHVYAHVLHRYEQSDRVADVLEVMERAASIAKADGDFHLLLARAHDINQDLPSAMKSALLAVNTDPNRSDFWSAISIYSSRLRAEHPSLTPSHVLEEMIAPSVQDDRSLLFVARLYRQLGDTQASQKYYDRLLQVDPGNAEALGDLRLEK